MSNVVDNPEAQELAEQHSRDDLTCRVGAPTSILFGAAALAVLLTIVAMVTRYRAGPSVRIEWGMAPAVDISPSHENLTGEVTGIRRTELLEVESKLPAGLGAKLDAVRFGDLGTGSRFDPGDVIPISRRWQLDFAPGLTEGQYAKHLDALGIELGVLATDGSLQYVAGLGGVSVTRRGGTRKAEKRPYWTWDRGDLRRADQVLLNNAGLPLADEIVLHFLSAEKIEALNQLENEFKGREPQDISSTRFALRRTFRGYEIYVAQQVER